MPASVFATVRLVLALGLVALLGHYAPYVLGLFAHGAEAALMTTFFSIALIFSLSFGIFYLSRGTPLPSFVIAIFFGIAAHPLLIPVIHNHAVLGALVGFGATLILFGGGLETPFTSFKKLFGKIMMLSFVGLGLTAVLFSLSLTTLGNLVGSPLSITATILLGALLASTDPAAIIPVLKRLRFKNPSTKDLIVSESAVTDVTGTLLTVAFLGLIAAGTLGSGILEGYGQIFSVTSGQLLLRQLIFGTAFGVVGYALLHSLTKFKNSHEREYEADSAFFLFIPLIIFTLALAFGGSGYLAAFVAGLLFKLDDNLHETERFFNHTIDGFFKPTIFLLLGALVDVPALITYAPLGLLIAAVFMFIIRPLTVFISLSPFTFLGKDKMRWSEILFISFVRETGAIPAVLLVTIASLNLPGMDGLLPIGMWVILATLIIEPPLTPWLAEKLKVAKVIPEVEESVTPHANSAVVLGSRGGSWKNRLAYVAEWANRHHVPNVTLLLCLEYKHTQEKAARIKREAQSAMTRLNTKFKKLGLPPIHYEIKVNIIAIFVGRKMLDYNLDQVKKLAVPLHFLR